MGFLLLPTASSSEIYQETDIWLLGGVENDTSIVREPTLRHSSWRQFTGYSYNPAGDVSLNAVTECPSGDLLDRFHCLQCLLQRPKKQSRMSRSLISTSLTLLCEDKDPGIGPYYFILLIYGRNGHESQ